MMGGMSDDTADWVRLGRFVQQRRAAKGLSQSAAAASAGISRGVWSAIEKATGSKPYDTTLAAIERTIDWAPGSCEDIKAGGVPTELEPRPSTADEKADAILALSTVEGLPDYEVAFLRGIAEKIRKQGDPSPNRTQSATG